MHNNEKFDHIAVIKRHRMKNDVAVVGYFWPTLFALYTYLIVDYFDLFSLSFAFIDIPVINNLYRFSYHSDLISFVLISHIVLQPFIFLCWMFLVPTLPKKILKVSIIQFILVILFFSLLFLGMHFITPESLSVRKRESFQYIFENSILFYIFYLLPLIFIPYACVFSFKNYSFVFKFSIRSKI